MADSRMFGNHWGSECAERWIWIDKSYFDTLGLDEASLRDTYHGVPLQTYREG